MRDVSRFPFRCLRACVPSAPRSGVENFVRIFRVVLLFSCQGAADCLLCSFVRQRDLYYHGGRGLSTVFFVFFYFFVFCLSCFAFWIACDRLSVCIFMLLPSQNIRKNIPVRFLLRCTTPNSHYQITKMQKGSQFNMTTANLQYIFNLLALLIPSGLPAAPSYPHPASPGLAQGS